MNTVNSITAGIDDATGAPRLIRHRRHETAARTLCGVELAGTRVSRPAAGDDVHPCAICAQRDVADLSPHDHRVVAAVAAALAALGGPRTVEELELIAAAAAAAAAPLHPSGECDPDARGCQPFELLPYCGLVLYDDERGLLAWARRGGTDELEATIGVNRTRRADTIVGALEALGRLRLRRLEDLAGDSLDVIGGQG